MDAFDEPAINAFVAQPARHTDEDPEVAPARAPRTRQRGSWRRGLTHFFFEHQPSGYSSIAPRRLDGTRTRIFFFNGGGRGR